ncbi:MAG: ribosomal protein S18-alanine N-acetyltransferase [Thiotrichaceae bacterium]|nr:ribosomal protein S18-alanine N-acetyltransferase [Thiotrichaceae bacterium]
MIEQSNQLSFTEMSTADINDVIFIEEQVYTHPWTRGIFHDCLKVDYDCYVLKSATQQVVAYLIIAIAVEEMHILNLCVHPDYQGKHLGSQLVEKSHRMALIQKVKQCFLEVRPSNKIAIALYSNYGYQRVGLRKNYYPSESGREDAIVMKKIF